MLWKKACDMWVIFLVYDEQLCVDQGKRSFTNSELLQKKLWFHDWPIKREYRAATDGTNLNLNNARPSLSTDALTALESCNREYPPGIKNSNTICFMNCVLQTLSRTPWLMAQIDSTVSETVFSDLDSEKFGCLKELLAVFLMLLRYETQEISYRPDHKSAIDTTNLRKFFSKLNSITNPDSVSRQSQEDAGEFLTWLLEFLNEVLVTHLHSQTSK